jgi:hypothetical protein
MTNSPQQPGHRQPRSPSRRRRAPAASPVPRRNCRSASRRSAMPCALEQELACRCSSGATRAWPRPRPGSICWSRWAWGLALIDQALRDLRAMNRPGRRSRWRCPPPPRPGGCCPASPASRQLHPDVDLRCITTDTDPDLARERIDLAITLGTGEFPQHQRWHFVDEEIFPVCSPAYLATGRGPLSDVQALTRRTLLHLEERYAPAAGLAGLAGALWRGAGAAHQAVPLQRLLGGAAGRDRGSGRGDGLAASGGAASWRRGCWCARCHRA